MKSGTSYLPFVLLAAASIFGSATAQRRRKGGNGNAGAGNTATGARTKGTGANVNSASGTADGTARVTTATDGLTIMDMTVNINNLPIRFKISAPAEQFLASTGIPGATATAASAGNTTMGINVLLHGDGGQSFFDFPNQAVQQNLMGVVALAPDPNLFWGGGGELDRIDGVAHSAAVNSLVQDILPQVVSFNKANTFFTGISGGALMLSGFFIPAHMKNYNTGVELNCGALAPQVDFVDSANVLAKTRIHFQSTQNELADLQISIPQSVAAYQRLATAAGIDNATLGTLQTVDNSPVGGHCVFDGQGFVSGVQLMADNYANVMQAGGNGQVTGIGKVANSVVGSRLTFKEPRRQKKRSDIMVRDQVEGKLVRPNIRWVVNTDDGGSSRSEAIPFKA